MFFLLNIPVNLDHMHDPVPGIFYFRFFSFGETYPGLWTRKRVPFWVPLKDPKRNTSLNGVRSETGKSRNLKKRFGDAIPVFRKKEIFSCSPIRIEQFPGIS
jgi:hypothetical protein